MSRSGDATGIDELELRFHEVSYPVRLRIAREAAGRALAVYAELFPADDRPRRWVDIARGIASGTLTHDQARALSGDRGPIRDARGTPAWLAALAAEQVCSAAIIGDRLAGGSVESRTFEGQAIQDAISACANWGAREHRYGTRAWTTAFKRAGRAEYKRVLAEVTKAALAEEGQGNDKAVE